MTTFSYLISKLVYTHTFTTRIDNFFEDTDVVSFPSHFSTVLELYTFAAKLLTGLGLYNCGASTGPPPEESLLAFVSVKP